MQRTAHPMTDQSLALNTMIAQRQRDSLIAQAEKIQSDPDKEARLSKCLCVVCFYRGARIGGAAITSQPCMACHEVQQYASTVTDKLCRPCGTKHRLCVRCGADIELKQRKVWPQADNHAE